jgi:hypothetical protein
MKKKSNVEKVMSPIEWKHNVSNPVARSMIFNDSVKWTSVAEFPNGAVQVKKHDSKEEANKLSDYLMENGDKFWGKPISVVISSPMDPPKNMEPFLCDLSKTLKKAKKSKSK